MQIKRAFSSEAFNRVPVMGILRNYSYEIIDKIAPLYQKAGLTTLEITMNTEGAEQTISALAERYPALNVGAGTVCEMDDLHAALGAGASFIVTPVLNEEVIAYCVKNVIPVFPGAFTPTEIYKAWKLGATAVKIFPSSLSGAAYVKELKGPLNKIPLLPTGGISLANVEDFFEAGAAGVGMGSALFDKRMILNNDLDSLYLHFEALYAKVKECRRTDQQLQGLPA